ncbi:MAG: hypothetical protein PUA57_02565 [Eggerthellales bacterium]|nr:hypothetical protein [Eggerthellales bacterium]
MENLEEILLGGRAFYTRTGNSYNTKDNMAPAEQRIQAALAMGASHNIGYYPLLRKSAQTDPDANVRAAVKQASLLLEEEFGEDACLQANEDHIGPRRSQGGSEEAHMRGDFFGADLNDFR